MTTFIIVVVVLAVACRFLIPLGIRTLAGMISPATGASSTHEGSSIEKGMCILNFILFVLMIVLLDKIVMLAVIAIAFIIELAYAVMSNKSRGGCYLWLFTRNDRNNRSGYSSRNGYSSRGGYSSRSGFNSRRNNNYRNNDYRDSNYNYRDTDSSYRDDEQYGPKERRLGKDIKEKQSVGKENENETDETKETKATIAEGLLSVGNTYGVTYNEKDKIPARNIKNKPVFSVVGSTSMWIDSDGLLYYKEDGKIRGIHGRTVEVNGTTKVYVFASDKDCDTIAKHSKKATISYYSNEPGDFEAAYFITEYGETITDVYMSPAGFNHLYSYDDVEIYFKGSEYRLSVKTTEGYVTMLNPIKENGKLSFVLIKQLGSTRLEPTKESTELSFYLFTKEGKFIKRGGEVEVGSAKEEVIKDLSLTRKTVKVVQNLVSTKAIKEGTSSSIKIKKTGISKDGVYNDGTFDLMCRFGEIQFDKAVCFRPFIQSVVFGKLILEDVSVSVLDKIGDNWKDIHAKDAPIIFENRLSEFITTGTGGEWNIWLTDDTNVWFMSIVYLSTFNINMSLDDTMRAKIQNIVFSIFNGLSVKPDVMLGYSEVVNPIDLTKVKTVIDSQLYTQNYYKLSQAVMSDYKMYLTKAKDEIQIVRAAIVQRLPFLPKMTITDISKIKNTGVEGLEIYSVHSSISEYEKEQLFSSDDVIVFDIEKNYTPQKLRDIYSSVTEIELSDFIAIIGEFEGAYEFNFIVPNIQVGEKRFTQRALNSALVQDIHYRLNKYIVKEGYEILVTKRR